MCTKISRTIIRNEAAERDCRYRITSDGEVHFHNDTGWWLYAQSVDEAVARIEGRAA